MRGKQTADFEDFEIFFWGFKPEEVSEEQIEESWSNILEDIQDVNVTSWLCEKKLHNYTQVII